MKEGSPTSWQDPHGCDIHTGDLGGQLDVGALPHAALADLQVHQVASARCHHNLKEQQQQGGWREAGVHAGTPGGLRPLPPQPERAAAAAAAAAAEGVGGTKQVCMRELMDSVG